MFDQLDFVYQISDDPYTGYKRKVRVYGFFFRSREKQLIIYCEVFSFTDTNYDNLVDTKRLQVYEIELQATMNTFIDPNTGNIVFEPTEGYITEYEYWLTAAKAGINMDVAFAQTIQIADGNGRFN